MSNPAPQADPRDLLDPCPDCGRAEATHVCKACGEVLCPTCLRAHARACAAKHQEKPA